MLGAYACYLLINIGLNFWATLIVAPAKIGAISFLIERTLLRKMYRLEHGFHLLFTLGLAWVLQECVILYLGPVGVNVEMTTLLSSEVRRVGKEGSSTCSFGWWPAN